MDVTEENCLDTFIGQGEICFGIRIKISFNVNNTLNIQTKTETLERKTKNISQSKEISQKNV